MKRTIISASVLALAVAGTGLASAEKPAKPAEPGPATFKVTGGGQFITSGGDIEGAGSTIAFNAQQVTADFAKGQVQFVDRSGEEQVVRHGTVSCVAAFGPLTADGNMSSARIGGTFRATSTEPEQPFVIDVTDNGEGANAANADMIALRETDDNNCTADEDGPSQSGDDFQASFDLGRGNVQVHKAKA